MKIEVIEDLVQIGNISVNVLTDEKITSVRTVFENRELDFKCENGRISFIIPKLYCSELIELQYENK